MNNFLFNNSHSAHNLSFFFDVHLTLSDKRLHLSTKPANIMFINFIVSGLTSIRKLRVPLPPLSFTSNLITVTISKLLKSHSSRLQKIHNSLARTVVKAPKSCHIISTIRSLRWLKIAERIEYKLLLLSYKVLITTQPPYLHNLTSVQRLYSTRSSLVVTLARPPTSSSLKITDCSYQYGPPCLWN